MAWNPGSKTDITAEIAISQMVGWSHTHTYTYTYRCPIRSWCIILDFNINEAVYRLWTTYPTVS